MSQTKSEPPVTGCNFVDFSRNFSMFQLSPRAQLKKTHVIPVLWIPTFHLCSFLSLFTLYWFPIFPIFLPSLLFILNSAFYSRKSQSIFQPAFLKSDCPMSVHLLAEVEQVGLFPYLWNAATSEVEHCSHPTFSMCLESLERERKITFSPESTFLGKLNITWN